jgi:hypothetical protein
MKRNNTVRYNFTYAIRYDLNLDLMVKNLGLNTPSVLHDLILSYQQLRGEKGKGLGLEFNLRTVKRKPKPMTVAEYLKKHNLSKFTLSKRSSASDVGSEVVSLSDPV